MAMVASISTVVIPWKSCYPMYGREFAIVGCHRIRYRVLWGLGTPKPCTSVSCACLSLS